MKTALEQFRECYAEAKSQADRSAKARDHGAIVIEKQAIAQTWWNALLLLETSFSVGQYAVLEAAAKANIYPGASWKDGGPQSSGGYHFTLVEVPGNYAERTCPVAWAEYQRRHGSYGCQPVSTSRACDGLDANASQCSTQH